MNYDASSSLSNPNHVIKPPNPPNNFCDPRLTVFNRSKQSSTTYPNSNLISSIVKAQVEPQPRQTPSLMSHLAQTYKQNNSLPYIDHYSSNTIKVKQNLKVDETYLKVLYFNSRSLKNKVKFLHAYMSQKSPFEYDLVFITETWLKPEFSDSLFCPDGYNILRRDRKDNIRGGGVLALYKSDLRVIDITPHYDSDVFESLVIELIPAKSCSTKLRFCCTYLPPSKSTTITGIKSCCTFLKPLICSAPLFIVGDFNLPTIDWHSMCSNKTTEQYFTDFCIQMGLTQHITDPTYHGLSDSTLDLVLTNTHGANTLMSTSLVQPISSTCDHDAVILKIGYKPDEGYTSSKPMYCFAKADYGNVNSQLSLVDWNSLVNMNPREFQQSYDDFLFQLHCIIENVVPKKCYRKGFTLPKYLKKIARKKSLLYKKKKSNPSLKFEYVEASKAYEKEVKSFFSSIESKICTSGDRSNFYKYTNRKLKLKTHIPSVVQVNGSIISDNVEKANYFNEQFSSVFQVDDGKDLALCDKTSIQIGNINITSEDINRALSMMKNKASITPDNIPPLFLKKTGNSLLPALKRLFQESLNNGNIPHQWKTALVNPVHKKGSLNNALNYRPISLTSAICRLLESIIRYHILKHLYENNLISSKQHGFLPRRSTCSQLLVFLNQVIKSFDAKMDAHIVYTDFSKAFDKVCHQKLLQVLSSYGITGVLLKWIENWLTNRTQSVYVGESTSSTTRITSGVPQGSVLGPLLFVMYIQDIESVCSPMCDVGIFADDCKFISINKDALQDSLNNMAKFVADRQLVLSEQKCSHFIVSRNETNCRFSINGRDVPTTTSIRDLGVTLTSTIKWKTHVIGIVGKATHVSHKILFSFSTNNIETLLLAYKTYVRPILESNSVVWNPHQIEDVNRIESVQRFFTMKLFQRCGMKSSGYENRLSQLDLKSLEHRRIAADLTMIFKILYNYVDIDPSVLFEFKQSQYHLRGHSLTLERPKAAGNTALNSFPSRVIRLWNGLSNHTVSSISPATFKHHVNQLDLVKLKKSSMA